MKEEYLHFLWSHKLLPFHKLQLVSGETVHIIEPGWLNTDSGPDFFSGKIKLDGITWTGNIEFHVNASDWYKHGHQNDSAYENVILHVVYNYDKKVFVNDLELPTVEIKKHVDQHHYKRYLNIFKKDQELPCTAVLSQKEVLDEQINLALDQRLIRKASSITSESATETLWYCFIKSFGGRLNKMPFEELSKKIPFTLFLKEAWDLQRSKAIVFGVSGLLENKLSQVYDDEIIVLWNHIKKKHHLETMNFSSWKFRGVRHGSFPDVRLIQCAYFLYHWRLKLNKEGSVKKIIEEYKSLFKKVNENLVQDEYGRLENKNLKITPFLQQIILINALAVYFTYLGIEESNEEYFQKSIFILESLPAEQNKILKFWKNNGVEANNAAQSQGLIELKNEFCNFKRCLQCKIGQQLLN